MERHRPYKLAVILHADVVDSTALVQRNETLAHEVIQRAFGELSDAVRSYGGMTREIRGDALVAEFARASDAVCAALHYQESHRKRDTQSNDEDVPTVRIGIALGEGISADGIVTGPGVVLAQRVEQLAPPGGVCVTAAIHEALPRRLPFLQQSLGEQTLKGFDEPVRVYRIGLEPGQLVPPAEGGHRLPAVAARRGLVAAAWVAGVVLVVGAVLWWGPWAARWGEVPAQPKASGVAARPSIVVLPFENLSGDPQQERFADGMTEDLITDLSGIAGVLVIASNTSFSYKGRQVSAKQVQTDLDVDYVLDGSVRRDGSALRVNAQLVDARTAYQVWARRYDRLVDETFAVQDDLTHQIVETLAVQLSPGERKRLARQPTNNLAAYDYFQEGQRLSKINTRETNLEAQAAYRKAIDIDPGYGRAYGALAYTMGYNFRRGWNDAPMQTVDRALELAQRAVELDSSIPQTYWSLGYVHTMRKEFAQAEAAVQKALDIAPNFADGYGLLALIKNGRGDAQAAIENIRKGMQLNPYYTWDYPYNLGRAHYILGKYDEAISELEAAKSRNPNVVPIRLFLAASYMRAGREDDAQWEAEEIQAINPDETLSHLANTSATNDKESLQRLLDDLRRAGLPE